MAGIAEQPALILIYSPPKRGKTSDVLFAFPRAKWIAAPGALKPSLGLVGYEPPRGDQHDAESIADATKIVSEVKAGAYDAVVVDDLSLLVDRTVARLARSGADGFGLWGKVHDQILALREASRRAGMHVAITCHESPPHVADGTSYPGAPALPGKTLPYKLPAACDLVLHAEPAPMGTVSLGWRVLYRCDPTDASWISGDRHNVTPDPAPMNLGEILRLAGRVGGNPRFGPRRLPGLEWQEPLVQKASERIEPLLGDDDAVRDVLRAVVHGAQKHHRADERHALWAARDALDRAILNRGLSVHRRKFFGI
jgi:hypothetical protein